MMALQLSQKCTKSNEDAGELAVAITCNTALGERHATRIPEPNRRLLQPFRLQYFYQRVSCRGKVLIKEFCYCNELLGNNIEDVHQHWHEVVAQVTINPVIKACALSFSVVSTLETTELAKKKIGKICGDRWLMIVGIWFVAVLTIKWPISWFSMHLLGPCSLRI